MKKKLTRWFYPVLIAVLATFMFITPILAIDDPDDISVDAVWVYRNCRETGDQLYLIYYTIDYSVIGNPDETVTEAFLCRLLDGTTELKAIAPFTYVNDGYGEGVVAIYFSTADAPLWEGAYTMELIGNPTLAWTGAPPSDTLATFNLWQNNSLSVSHVVVSSRIIGLAEDLETAWSVDMVQQDTNTGEYALTIYGEAYFSGVVPYLTDVAPYVFMSDQPGSGIIQPEVPEIDTSTDYADLLETLVIDTPFDLTPLAVRFGVSRGALSAILYYGFLAVVVIIASRRIGSFKPLMLFSLPLVLLGAFLGVPLIVTILVGFLSLGMIAFTLFYKPSNA